MSSVASSSVPVVGFAGPRSGPAASASSLVSSLVGSVLASGRGVASGCASGVDSLAVSAALAAAAGPRLSVFCAFGPSGLGALGRSSAPPSSLVPVVASGGRVVWWAGGAPRPGGPVPRPVSRLVGRSLAFVRALALAAPGSGLVVLVSGPPPRGFARSSSRRLAGLALLRFRLLGVGRCGGAAPSARRCFSRRLVRFLAGGVAPASRSGWALGARRCVRSLVRRLALVRLVLSVSFRAARVRRPFSFQEVPMKTFARAAWLLPSPAVRRQFEARDIPVPVRLPVWLHSDERTRHPHGPSTRRPGRGTRLQHILLPRSRILPAPGAGPLHSLQRRPRRPPLQRLLLT